MKKLFGAVVVAVLIAGCSSSNSTKTTSAGASISINLVTSGAASVAKLSPRELNSSSIYALVGGGPLVGQTTEASLESLQYYVQSIQLCQDMAITGTGYSGTTGCIQIYTNPDTTSSSVDFYNTYSVTEALADTNPDHYIDFMTAEGRAKLATPLTLDSTMVGTYKYGLINFMRPIKIKATFIAPDGITPVLYSKTPNSSQVVDGGLDSGGRQIEYSRPVGTSSPSAELMTYMLNNGGTWFPFLKPFELTQADIDSGNSIKIDFAFNPNNFASAAQQTSSCAGGIEPPVRDETDCVTFDLPYAKMAPVPRKTGEATKKEVYLVDYETTGAGLSQLRVELYFNGSDPDRSIQGVDVSTVSLPTATQFSTSVVSAYKVAETAGVVTMYSYNEATSEIDAVSLDGLTRGVDGSVTIKCVYVGGPCTVSDGSSLTRNYTYAGEVTVASD